MSLLQEAFQELRRVEKISIHLEALKFKISDQKKEVKRQEKILQKETIDLDKLGKMSLVNLFVKVMGNKEAALEKERQEYLMAFLEYEAAANLLQSLIEERDKLKKEKSALFGADKRYASMLKETELQLKISNKTIGNKIRKSEERLNNFLALSKEIEEAIAIAEETQTAGINLKKELKKLTLWSIGNQAAVIDYSGKGRYSTYKKKKFIERGKDQIYSLNVKLVRFQSELEDVSTLYNLDYTKHLDVISHFLETFLDALITDYVVRKKIKSSISAIEMVIDKIERIQLMLLNEKDKVEDYIIDEQSAKEEMILKYSK